MRISDWSSDVCSSDLAAERRRGHAGDLMTRLRWRQDDRKHRCELVAHQGKSHGMNPHITVRRVETAADRKAIVELAFRLNEGDPNWVPPLKQDVRAAERRAGKAGVSTGRYRWWRVY